VKSPSKTRPPRGVRAFANESGGEQTRVHVRFFVTMLLAIPCLDTTSFLCGRLQANRCMSCSDVTGDLVLTWTSP